MKNNKGFISTSVIFAFFITFLMLLVIIITSYAQNRILMNQVKKDIKSKLVIKYDHIKNDTSVDEPQIIVPEVAKLIEKAFTYNQTSGATNYCVTGNEETCQETKCYENTSANSCASGTIVDYKVNDTDTVRFHVMYDNGSTMTMQSQKNTVYNIAWYGTNDNSTNTKGPMTILPVLEEKTNGWKNVNEQTYTMGTTVFKTNSFTGCSAYNTCDANTYTLDERTANARMISVQEAADLECTESSNSCPIWMYNYLQTSTSNGGTVDDTTVENGGNGNWGYWTMNAYAPENYNAWSVSYLGRLSNNFVSYTGNGIRAVVEINK